MKQNVKMAKVITMDVAMNSKYTLRLVTTVDPIVNPEMVKAMHGIIGRIVKSEESNVMPLPFALDFSRRQREKLGITNCYTIAN